MPSALRSYQHRWSLALLDALRAAYPEGGPDLVEFNDYWGEGAMTVEARRSGDPLLRGTTVVVRTRTTHELTAALNGGELGDYERVLHGLERSALRGADAVLWPGGDVLGTYERFYGPRRSRPPGWCRRSSSPPAVAGRGPRRASGRQAAPALLRAPRTAQGRRRRSSARCWTPTRRTSR